MTQVLGLIPARGGSKGLPGKNLRLLAGKSLLAHAVLAARASAVIDRLVLSTDDEAIAQAGRDLGVDVPFLRPAELASDAAGMLGVVQHALRCTPGLDAVEWVATLQPTSPLRTPSHIRAALELARDTGADSVVGVVALPRTVSPDYVMRIEGGERLVPFLEGATQIVRRQDARPAYMRDGTIYLTRRSVVERGSLYGDDCRALVVDADASLSIDTESDWSEAERRMQRREALE